MNQIYESGGIIRVSGKEFKVHDSFKDEVAIFINGAISWIPSELIESYTPSQQTEWINAKLWNYIVNDRQRMTTREAINLVLSERYGNPPPPLK